MNSNFNHLTVIDPSVRLTIAATAGAALGCATGLLTGFVIKSGAIHTAKVFAVITAIGSVFMELAKQSFPKEYHIRVGDTTFAICNVIYIFALRHFNIIAKTGTIVCSILTAYHILNAIKGWTENSDAIEARKQNQRL
jgi:hypothetical protein